MNARRSIGLILGLAIPTTLAGCSDKPPAYLADRLWVAEMPSGPRDLVDALVLTEIGKRSMGTYYHGSIYRGSHDSFTWKSKGKDAGVIRLLQDQREYSVKTKPCKPDRGFDMCVLLEGDPKKIVRYQSRKRWAIPRRGAERLDVPGLMFLLADDDDDFEALFEADD